MQRAIETEGVSTISVTMFRQLALRLKLPRVVSLRFPFGYPLGRDEKTQRQIIGDAVVALETITEPGTIVDLPYVWQG